MGESDRLGRQLKLMDGAGSSHPLRLMYISLSLSLPLSVYSFFFFFFFYYFSSGFPPNEGPCYSWEVD